MSGDHPRLLHSKDVLDASVAIRSKMSLTNEFKMAMALFEIPVSGWTCLRTIIAGALANAMIARSSQHTLVDVTGVRLLADLSPLLLLAVCTRGCCGGLGGLLCSLVCGLCGCLGGGGGGRGLGSGGSRLGRHVEWRLDVEVDVEDMCGWVDCRALILYGGSRVALFVPTRSRFVDWQTLFCSGHVCTYKGSVTDSTRSSKYSSPRPIHILNMSGKGGKAKSGGKASSETKSQSRSAKAGLQFPVGRVHRLLKKGNYAQRVGAGAPGKHSGLPSVAPCANVVQCTSLLFWSTLQQKSSSLLVTQHATTRSNVSCHGTCNSPSETMKSACHLC